MLLQRRLSEEGAGGAAGFSSTIDSEFIFKMDTAELDSLLDQIIAEGENFKTALDELSAYFGDTANLWKGADAASLAANAPAPIIEMNKRKQEIDNLCAVANELRRVIDQGQSDLSSNVHTALGGTNGGVV